MSYFESPLPVAPYSTLKACVILPVKNRAHHVRVSLPFWLEQTYSKLEIVIVDYDSSDDLVSVISKVARKHDSSVCFEPNLNDDRYNNKEKITYLKLSNKPTFNIGHALNYGILNSSSSAVLISGCDAIPVDYYVEMCMNMIDQNKFVLREQSRVCFPRELWCRVNGYQEILTGWGGEDHDFITRIRKSSSGIRIDTSLIQSLRHGDDERTESYKEKFVRVSNYENWSKYEEYYHKIGWIGNYNLPCGQKDPVAERKVDELIIFVAVTPRKVKQNITTISTLARELHQDDKYIYSYIVPKVKEMEDHVFCHGLSDATIYKKYLSIDIWSALDIFDDLIQETIQHVNKTSGN